MAASGLALEISQPANLVQSESWYALQTRSRHEKIVAQRLEERGVTAYLPLLNEVHRWSDRKKSVELPLFSSYVFARFAPNRTERLRALRVEGVVGLVGARGEGSPIPEEQIAAVQSVMKASVP
jgi:transcription antitermination factor NusG